MNDKGKLIDIIQVPKGSCVTRTSFYFPKQCASSTKGLLLILWQVPLRQEAKKNNLKIRLYLLQGGKLKSQHHFRNKEKKVGI